MAGVLLYTAVPDSEGTLGGLVALGAPDRLGSLIEGAMERARICTSDPFCATHLPNGVAAGGSVGDGSLHGAACHVCLFLRRRRVTMPIATSIEPSSFPLLSMVTNMRS